MQNEMNAPGTREVQLFLGRLQPVHNGHANIINNMTNGVVAIVRGEKSGEDKARNPLNESYQIRLIEKINPNVKVIVTNNGYLPDIINILRESNQEVTTVYAGADRIKQYQAQVERANKKLDEENSIEVKFIETGRLTSASLVRDAIRKGDEETFKQTTPETLWEEWDTLREIIKVATNTPIKSFSEYLSEDVNTTAGVEMRNPVMTSTPIRPASLEYDTPENIAKKAKKTRKKDIDDRKKANLVEETDLDIPNLDDCLGKLRHTMPQLTKYDDFVDAVKEAGGEIEDTECEPKKLIPTQKNFNEDKVKRLIDAGDIGKPIVVSKDGYVIDGHHRWLAAHRMGENIKCRTVSFTAEEIFELCKDADYVEKKKINENTGD